MMRLGLAVLVLTMSAGFLLYLGGEAERTKREIETLQRQGDIKDAINRCSDAHWFDRLQCRD